MNNYSPDSKQSHTMQQSSHYHQDTFKPCVRCLTRLKFGFNQSSNQAQCQRTQRPTKPSLSNVQPLKSLALIKQINMFFIRMYNLHHLRLPLPVRQQPVVFTYLKKQKQANPHRALHLAHLPIHTFPTQVTWPPTPAPTPTHNRTLQPKLISLIAHLNLQQRHQLRQLLLQLLRPLHALKLPPKLPLPRPAPLNHHHAHSFPLFQPVFVLVGKQPRQRQHLWLERKRHLLAVAHPVLAGQQVEHVLLSCQLAVLKIF